MTNLLKKSIALLVVVVSTVAWAELPHISDVHINPTPPGAKVSAVYLNIHNPTDTELELLTVSSPAIARVEIHKTEVIDDVATMRKQNSVVLAANEQVAFEHGGLHIMLMGLEGPMVPGDKIPLVFHTNQGDITITANVAENIAIPGDSDHNDMDHNKTKHGKMNHDDTTDHSSESH